MALFVYPATPIDTSGLATEAKQDVIIAELVDVNSELDAQTTLLTDIETNTDDVATETTLATVKTDTASIVTNTADNATETTLAALDAKVTAVDTTGKATEAKQDDIITELQTLNTSTADIATETTLSALNAKVTAVDTTGKATEAKQDSVITELQSANTSLDNIEADIDALNARLAGALVPAEFDYIALTYVAAGNGAGEIETATYRTGGAAGTIQATLTLAYDAQNRLASVTKA